eukprot:5118086-Pyramimonas_sp.AAC.1
MVTLCIHPDCTRCAARLGEIIWTYRSVARARRRHAAVVEVSKKWSAWASGRRRIPVPVA